MTTKPMTVLHLEDERIAQQCVAFFLNSIQERVFDIQYALSEDEGIARFQRGDVGLVILDFRLRHGNGLSFLRRLRQLDESVPVVVISGEKNSDISEILVFNGADAFLGKGDLTGESLIESVREVLDRAEKWQRQDRPYAGIEHQTWSSTRELAAAR